MYGQTHANTTVPRLQATTEKNGILFINGKQQKKNWTQSWIRQGKKIGLTNAYIEIVKKSLVIARINGNN